MDTEVDYDLMKVNYEDSHCGDLAKVEEDYNHYGMVKVEMDYSHYGLVEVKYSRD